MKNILLIVTISGIVVMAALGGIQFAVTQQIKHAIENLNNRHQELNIKYDVLKNGWPWSPVQFEDLTIRLQDCQTDLHNSMILNCGNFIISGLSLVDFIIKKEIKINHIEAIDWHLEAIQDPAKESLFLGCLGKGGQNFPRFKINHLKMHAGEVTLKHYNDTANFKVGQAGLRVDAENFFKDSTYWQYESVVVQFNKLFINSPDSLHRLSIAGAYLDSGRGGLVIDSLEVKSWLDPEDIEEQTDSESHRYKMSVPKITGDDLNLDSLLFHQHMRLGNLAMDHGAMHFYYDKRPAHRSEEIEKLPHQWLQSVPFSFSFNEIRMGEWLIIYEEHVKDWTHPGRIVFDQTEITIAPFDSREDDNISVLASSRLMGSSQLKSCLVIPVHEPFVYNIQGSLEKLELTSLNPMLALITDSHIASGLSEQLEFEWEHNQQHAHGALAWYYKDLKIALNERKGKSNISKKAGTLIINSFLVRNDNPNARGFKGGTIDYSRDSTRSVFNFWWKSLASGLTSTIQ